MGDLGPKLITRIVREQNLGHRAQQRRAFYPVEFKDVWKLFDPA